MGRVSSRVSPSPRTITYIMNSMRKVHIDPFISSPTGLLTNMTPGNSCTVGSSKVLPMTYRYGSGRLK